MNLQEPKNLKTSYTQEEFQKIISQIPKMNKKKLFSQDELKRRIKYMDMANLLYHESDKYNTFQERFDNLYEKYEELFIFSPGLFEIAINRTMYDGECGKIIKSFQESNCNASNIYSNLNNYNNNITNNIIEKINNYKNSNKIINLEQEKIEEIIKNHQKSAK